MMQYERGSNEHIESRVRRSSSSTRTSKSDRRGTRDSSSCRRLDSSRRRNSETTDPYSHLRDEKETAKKSCAFLRAVGRRVAAWRSIRSDSRLRVFVGIASLDRHVAGFVLPNHDPDRCRWLEVVLYITKPRALCLPPDKFHVTAAANRNTVYSAVTGIRTQPTSDVPGAPNGLSFYDITPTSPPDAIPDPSAEDFPTTEALRLDVDSLAEKCSPPKDPYDCVKVSVGAWWHRRQRCIYYLRMESSLLPICPEGWTTRSLGATLSRLLDHREGCETCAKRRDHVDAYNALWNPGPFADSCACIAPCLWRKAAQTDVPVRGDAALCQALFVASVPSVRILGPKNGDVGGSRITGRLEDVISAGGICKRVPVNSIGWHLVRLPETYSAAMVSGCARLSRVLG